jgi:tetratricopeptide (TPR) repeat protein
MEQNKTATLVKDIEGLLSNYLGKKDAEGFSKKLEKVNVSEAKKSKKLFTRSSDQVNSIITEGAKGRELIHSIISFAQERIEEEFLFKLMHDLSQLMIFKGEFDIATEICEDLIVKIGGNDNYSSIEADAYLALAKIAWSQAYWELSIGYVQKAYTFYQIKGDHHGYAKCENMLGTISGEQGDVLEAYDHFKKGLDCLSHADDVSLRSMFEINLGILQNMQGEYTKAMWNYKNALNKCIQLKDTRRIARIRHNLGMLYTQMKDYQAAIEEFDASISVSLEYGYLSNCAIGYIGKAYIYTKMNNIGLAEAFTDKALELAYKINDTLSIADVYKIKGMIQGNLENFELSAEMLENSLRLNEDFENKMNFAESSFELSKIYSKTKRNNEAEELKKSAVGYYDLVKAKSYIDELISVYSN